MLLYCACQNLEAGFYYKSILIILAFMFSTWRCYRKTFFTVSVLVIIMTMLDSSLADVAAESNPETISSSQTEAVISNASILPAPLPTFRAVVTQYSRVDSCHTVRNGKCIMASGRPVYVGAAACPDFLDFGTRVSIDGQFYTCEDRYAKWLDKKRGLPTVDIFVGKNPRGNSVKIVTIEE
jgi:hypothetical protein